MAEQLALELRPQLRGRLQVRPESHLERDLGIDSLGRLELSARLEQALGVRLATRAINEADTVRDLVRAVLASPGAAGIERLAATPPPEAIGAEPDSAATLPEVLAWHVARHPERRHALLLTDEGGERPVTYGELARNASAVATALAVAGLTAGDRVALMAPTSPDFLWGFFGCLLAGCVPVPVYPPARAAQLEEHLLRQRGILRDAGVAFLLLTPELRAAGWLVRPLVETLRGVGEIPALSTVVESPVRLPTRTADELALLQYTSGSTGNPKGVMLSHANLLANIRAMGAAMAASSRDIFVSWLPLYHDMGLIGAWLGTLYYGAPLLLLSPQRFLAHPEDWLWAMNHGRATLSAAPNFAFEVCASRIADGAIDGLDLSSVRMIANGAEPVSPGTLRRFQARFGPHGLRAEALAPVYGLAECTVGLAFPPLGRVPQIDRIDRSVLAERGLALPAIDAASDALELVACGRPLTGHAIRIVDEAGQEAAERREGRIQFKGPSATRGYFGSAAKTRKLYDGEWLETGDLGYLAQGDLYVTGRSKDLIIRAGRHIHPQQIEEAVGSLPGVRRGCVVAVGEPAEASGTEAVIILAETRETDPEARAALCRQIADRTAPLLGGLPEHVGLLPPHAIPKTSSGKLRRSATLARYHGGQLAIGARPLGRQLLELVLLGAPGRLRAGLRRTATWGFAAWWWFVIGVAMAVMWAVVMTVPECPARVNLLRQVARLALVLAGNPLTVRGLELLPPGNAILVANHSSYLDGLVLMAALPGPLAFAAKRELANQIVAGPFLRRLGCVYVERAAAAGAGTEAPRLEDAVRAGRRLVVFPEGTFDRAPGLLPFRLGAFQAAVAAGVPVVPVAVRGTRSALRGEQWLPRPQTIEVQVRPAQLPDASGFAGALRLSQSVRQSLLDATGEPDRIDEFVTIPRPALADGA